MNLIITNIVQLKINHLIKNFKNKCRVAEKPLLSKVSILGIQAPGNSWLLRISIRIWVCVRRWLGHHHKYCFCLYDDDDHHKKHHYQHLHFNHNHQNYNAHENNHDHQNRHNHHITAVYFDEHTYLTKQTLEALNFPLRVFWTIQNSTMSPA